MRERTIGAEKRFFEEKRKELESKFSEPEIRPYHIVYVEKNEPADAYISRAHIGIDYLAIGVAALEKTLKDYTDNEIKVCHKDFVSMDYLQFMVKCCPWMHKNGYKLYENAMLEQMMKVDEILQKYFHDERFSSFGAGLIMGTSLTVHMMGINELPEEMAKLTEFQNFDDVETAQMNAFKFIKQAHISSILGSLQALMHDE